MNESSERKSTAKCRPREFQGYLLCEMLPLKNVLDVVTHFSVYPAYSWPGTGAR